MLLSGFIINSSTLKNSVNNYFEDTNLADVWVYVDGVNADDLEFYEKLKEDFDIEFEQRLYFEVPVTISSVGMPNSAKIYISKGKISTPYVETESYLDLGKVGCLIDKKVAENYNIKTRNNTLSFTFNVPIGGNSVPIDIVSQIGGTMCFDECADTYSTWPIFFAEEEFLRLINQSFESKGLPQISVLPYNQVLVKTNNVELVKQKVEDYYSLDTTTSTLGFVFERNQVESVVLLNGEVEQSRKMIYVFPLIFLIVSILVILTTTNQLILQEQSKIGTLKSIGIPDKKILSHYSKYGTILVFIGSVLGLLLGWLVIPAVMFIKYNMVYSLPADYIKIHIPWVWIVLMFVLMVLLGYLVSYFSCRGILHKKPIECLRKDIRLNDNKLKATPKHTKRIPLPVKMAVRNVRLKPLRTIMATLGIAGCTALLLCGFGVGDTLVHSKNNDLEKVFKYDVSSTYNSDGFLTKLDNLDIQIDRVELYQKYFAQAVSQSSTKNIAVYQLEPNSKLSTISLKIGQIVISKNIAKDLKIDVGDQITLSVGKISKKVVVNGFVETSVFNGVYACSSLGFDDSLASKGVWISSPVNAETLVKEINKINGTNAALSMQQIMENVDQKISSIGVMTTTLKVFAIMLAVVVLLNLIFLILKERHKEIATLKVLGEDSLTIGLSVLFEILIMTVIGMIFGMFLGYPLLLLLLSINKVEVFNFLSFISPISYLFALLLIVVTVLIVFGLCQFKIKNINMIESLKSVE